MTTTKADTQTGGPQYLRLLELIPDIRLLIWEQYFSDLDIKIRSCSRRPGLFVVEPEILRLSKALRKELLQPYVWRLRLDLLKAHRALGIFGPGGEEDEVKEPSSPPWHATELKLQAEILELEICRIQRGSEATSFT